VLAVSSKAGGYNARYKEDKIEGLNHLKIICISDTHDVYYPELPEGDMLIHAGDVALGGELMEVQRFVNWFRAQPHQYKVFVGGNHDKALEGLGLDLFDPGAGITYLNNDTVTLGGLKIWGSPASRTYGHICAFMRDEDRLAYLYESIPEDTDIVITHQPPYGLRDAEVDGIPLGSPSLMRAIVRVKPKLHVYGHIHGGYGKSEVYGGYSVNASQLDVTYRKHNPPIEVTL
jgi:Icc-related predicted phosphoesterase